jgi:glycosyltransferase involved in cell wall biosynthesis
VNGGAAKKTLLVISPWERMWSLGGGAGVSDLYRFFDGFARAGYELHLILPEADDGPRDGSAAFDAIAGLHLHRFPNFFASMEAFPVAAKRLSWLPIFHALVVPRALRLSRALRPDAVIGLSHYSTVAAWACRRGGVPSCVKLFGVMDLVHTEWSRLKYWFKNFEQILALAFPQDAWIVLDDGTRGRDVVRARGIPDERIHFLPNGVNLEWADRAHDRAAARERFGLPRDAGVVLFLARLVASKRPQEVIHAIASVVGAGARDTVFVFAGDGPERASCQALAERLGVAARVHFTGAIAHDDVPELMAASDVFVSTSNLTNMALPTCEALVCGVPVVAYDVGDTASVVRTGETGALVRDGDAAALGSAIAAILCDAPGRARMSERAVAVARETFTSWEERIAMELCVVDDLIRAGRGKGVTSRARRA